MLGFAALGANPLGAVAAAADGAAYVPAASGTSTGSGSGGEATAGSGSTPAYVPAASGTSVGSGSGGEATAGPASTPAYAPPASGTSTGSGSGGEATTSPASIPAYVPPASGTSIGSGSGGEAEGSSSADRLMYSAVARLAGIAFGLPSPEDFILGETIRLAVQITDIAGNEADPLTIELRIKTPGQPPRAEPLTRLKAGQYYADLLLNQKGRWYCRVETSSPCPGLAECALNVQPSRFD